MGIFIFENASVILEDRILRGASVVVEKGKIAEILAAGKELPKGKRVDVQGDYLSPGFVDLHVHGAMGRDAMDANLESWNEISLYHASGGTTHFALTTVSSDWKDLEKVLKLAEKKLELEGAKLLGIHVEGPFLSKNKIGAHAEEYLCNPDEKGCENILEYASCITQMTLAPELEDALSLIKVLKKNHILPSAGHTDANEEAMMRAFRAGLKNATHLFNRMAGTDKKNPRNQKDAAKFILDHEIVAEMIADGCHVPVPLLREAWKRKGTDFLTLITDATAGAGLEEGAKFKVGKHIKAQVRDGCAKIVGEDILAGSTIRMIDAVRVMTQEVGVPLYEAVKMASYNPARCLGLEDKIGSIAVGKEADFVVFDKDFRVQQTYSKGNLLAVQTFFLKGFSNRFLDGGLRKGSRHL